MKTIVIVGLPRTGSSLTAGICQILGFNMGEKTASYYPEWNPTGTYENARFQRLDDRILSELGGSWENPPSEAKIKRLAEKGYPEVGRMIEREKSEEWGWKGCRTTLLLELYWKYISYRSPYLIICQRRLEDIAKSFKKTRMGNGEKVQKLAKIYDKRISDFIKNYPVKYLYIEFEDWFKKPKKQLDKLIDFLGIYPDEEQIEKALKFIIYREI